MDFETCALKLLLSYSNSSYFRRLFSKGRRDSSRGLFGIKSRNFPKRGSSSHLPSWKVDFQGQLWTLGPLFRKNLIQLIVWCFRKWVELCSSLIIHTARYHFLLPIGKWLIPEIFQACLDQEPIKVLSLVAVIYLSHLLNNPTKRSVIEISTRYHRSKSQVCILSWDLNAYIGSNFRSYLLSL